MFENVKKFIDDHKVAIISAGVVVGATIAYLLVNKPETFDDADDEKLKKLVDKNKDGLFIIAPKKDLPQDWYLTVTNVNRNGEPTKFDDIGRSISDGNDCDFTFIK